MSLMKYYFLFLIGSVSPTKASELHDKLTKITNAYIEQDMFQGNVLVAIDQQVVAFVSSAKLPQSARFEIGSIAKQFTTALMYLLKEKRLVDFNQPISGYIKEFSDYPVGSVTIQELLEHRSGLPRDFVTLAERDITRDLTSLQRLKRLKHISVSQTKTKRYSNAGFALLSLVIEAVAQKPFAQVLESKITKPLALSDTGVISRQNLRSLVQGTNRLNDQLVILPSAPQNYAIGHGAMYSSVFDLYQWQRALIKGEIVSKKSFAQMIEHNHGLFKYSYNWPSNKGANGRAITHGGSNEGFVANVSTYLNHELIVVILSNEKPAYVSALYNQLANAVLGMDEPLPYENLLKQFTQQVISKEMSNALAVFRAAQSAQRWDLPSAVQLNQSGYLYLTHGRLAEAEALFSFLTQVYPDYKNGWDSYAEALTANNKPKEAKKIRTQYLH
ncbi:serine hydrolase domain-containing protein [Thalassotalea sp. PP2-459]|uniref:serine hydrolase domain-containing protein n=1 Tax=Thalassotalea sp. PP2-459 TaxID=1742724 RepID=UPI000945D8F9|nr:serine hydrolase domain-containing protein [Thalassotalea sp. PP2-459]OKY26986.1 hypothetical protein BI291_10730 [Thalassotalea sp. PP2-459]